MKRFTAGIAFSIMILSSTPFAFADSNSVATNSASDISIQIDGKVQAIQPQPVIENGYTLVPLRSIFEKLGATVSWDAPSQTVTIAKDTKRIQIAVNSDFAVINGSNVKIDQPVQLVNNRAMIPLRFVSEALGADVEWDGVNRTVLIFSKGLNSALTNSGAGSSTSATGVPLTYDKALSLAMENSYPVKSASANIDRSKQVLDHYSDNVKYSPAAGGNAMSSALYATYAADNISYQNAQKIYDFTQESLAYGVKQAYNGVLQALEGKKLADLQLQNATLQQQIASANYQNGVIGKIDYDQANTAVTAAQSNQQAASKAVDNAYQQFDQLTGLPTDAKPQLIDIPQMTPLAQTDVNSKVTQAESQSPLLWVANQNVDLAKLGLKQYTFNVKTADPYQAKQIDVNLASYSAADQQKQLDQVVRSLYYQIKGMEDQYSKLQAAITSDEDALKKEQALYQNGMAIQADVTKAQLAVESDKQQMVMLAAQHDNAMLAFQTPWVIASSSNFGSSSAN
ncbi:TolC family protein [Fodinisporobacter ferrooxydans]|uniref:TolC family protein n=1 Tax=Fodinisporobacter ferrooxydans TaxID=2901836 RepID=A0ABY4CLY8_9BACL|nr:TolC family protein [Alicyclobacillaceae bacterium MYW30-H2]